MAQQKFEVLYKDGRKVKVLCTANALYEVEEKFSGVDGTNAVRASVWLAWASLRDAGMESADFDTWRKTLLAWVEELGPEAVTSEDVDPTPADISATGSPD